jgi:hypothetical protein
MAYSTSKTALNGITVHYARALEATSIKVNGAAPGHVATNFSVFTGKLTAEQGAAVAIRLAQLDSNGPTSLVFEDDHRLAWELPLSMAPFLRDTHRGFLSPPPGLIRGPNSLLDGVHKTALVWEPGVVWNRRKVSASLAQVGLKR